MNACSDHLSPPEPRPSPVAYDEQEQQTLQRCAYMAEALLGVGDFWDLDRYDAEQQYSVFTAAQNALCMGGSPAKRWTAFERALTLLVADYAQWRIER